MKKIFSIIAASAALCVSAQTSEFVYNPADDIKAINERIAAMEADLKKAEIDVIKVEDAAKQNTLDITAGASRADSLASRLEEVNSTLNNAITMINEELGTKIETTRSDINAVRSDTGSLRNYGFLLLGVLIVLVVGIYLILRKRIGDGSLDLKAVKEANRRLQEQSVDLDTRLARLLEQQLEMKNASAAVAEPDHSLVLSIAGELMRIEQNLAFMDPKTKGVSQLRNRAAAISASLRKKGYEVPALVGTEYKDGMNMEATMEEDETLESNKMIIRRVTRPAVLFNGKMIQSAAVVVAFNPEFEN